MEDDQPSNKQDEIKLGGKKTREAESCSETWCTTRWTTRERELLAALNRPLSEDELNTQAMYDETVNLANVEAPENEPFLPCGHEFVTQEPDSDYSAVICRVCAAWQIRECDLPWLDTEIGLSLSLDGTMTGLDLLMLTKRRRRLEGWKHRAEVALAELDQRIDKATKRAQRKAKAGEDGARPEYTDRVARFIKQMIQDHGKFLSSRSWDGSLRKIVDESERDYERVVPPESSAMGRQREQRERYLKEQELADKTRRNQRTKKFYEFVKSWGMIEKVETVLQKYELTCGAEIRSRHLGVSGDEAQQQIAAMVFFKQLHQSQSQSKYGWSEDEEESEEEESSRGNDASVWAGEGEMDVDLEQQAWLYREFQRQHQAEQSALHAAAPAQDNAVELAQDNPDADDGVSVEMEDADVAHDEAMGLYMSTNDDLRPADFEAAWGAFSATHEYATYQDLLDSTFGAMDMED
ncbi:hypothetical protein B0A55_04141 [Friedmanniomyces simplex]|uniref:Uncharacterized protein n=1 Tax=Friedmanniomyces simplex TaxID=329884 RepID=A0A4U0XU86_9PEZI|nr:hypothetical protein B0A55_04141 [Friedmanniomyces simplex]